MVVQEVRRECARRFYEAMQEAIEKVLLDLFITGAAEIKEKVKHAPNQYIQPLITTMAEKGTLEEVSDRDVER